MHDYEHQLRENMSQRQFDVTYIEKCCKYARDLLDKKLPVIFDKHHVENILRLQKINLCGYHSFSIANSKKVRIITAPGRELKLRQRWILDEILNKVEITPYAHGFESGRSIKTNAVMHAKNAYVICMDIKEFFSSIPESKVREIFSEIGYSTSAAATLAKVCCFSECLPQGAPSSPRLANIAFNDIDLKLALIAKSKNAVYSRYADDLTFSSNENINSIFSDVEETLRDSVFRINMEKCRSFMPTQPKIITGLIVQSGRVRVPKRFKRLLKQEIYYCKKFGALTHLENRNAYRMINYREYLYGKAYYIKMIEPEVGEYFLEDLDTIEWPVFSINAHLK